MAYSSNNIIVGAAAVYISVEDSSGTAFYTDPDNPGIDVPTYTASVTAKTAFEAATTDWRSTGYTQEGVEVTYEPDYGEVQVDQSLDTPKMYKQGMRVTVATTFAEATLENLLVAWGQPSSTLAASKLVISAGALGDEPVERSIAFVGLAPRGSGGERQERVYAVRRALQVESSAHRLSRNDPTVIPASFRLLPNTNASGESEYGDVEDRVVT